VQRMTRELIAIVFLTLVPLGGAVLTVFAWRRSPYNHWQTLLYFLVVLFARWLWRARVPRRLPFAEKQGTVVVANHTCSIDPFFIQLAAGRVVHWMVAREYTRSAAFGWFLRIVEAIPTRRGGQDTAALKQAMRYLDRGEAVGILPEGRINRTNQALLPVRPGAALIAIKAGVPLLPIYIKGAPRTWEVWQPMFTPAKTTVYFGHPIYPSDYLDHPREIDAAKRMILAAANEIARLAGEDDFEPQLAGRRYKPSDEQLARERRQFLRRGFVTELDVDSDGGKRSVDPVGDGAETV
jgi:1-acyl-sn-glycerol-3-phosphate acyltransferase